MGVFFLARRIILVTTIYLVFAIVWQLPLIQILSSDLNTKTFEVFNNLEFTVPILMLEVHMK